MKDVDSILKKEVDDNKSPSVQYLFFNQDKILHEFRYGYADLLTKRKVEPSTTLNAFSITKTFTAIAILKLSELKKLDIDQPASNYLPGFPYGNTITIRNLLAHTSGIPNPMPLNWIHLVEEHKTFDRNKFFKDIFSKNKKVVAEPGAKFAYSNPAYVLLGQIIEHVTGKSYEEYITETIINKCGVLRKELGFEISDVNSHATGYHKRFSFSNLILGLLIDKKKFMHQAHGAWKPFMKYYINGPSYGGLIGTPVALVKYVQEILKPNSAIVSEENKKLMFTENHTNNNKPTGMCLSWFTGKLNGEQYFSHAGGGGGFYCEIRVYPSSGKGSVIMFNRTGFTDERILDKFDNLAMGK